MPLKLRHKLKGTTRASCHARQMNCDYFPLELMKRARTGPLAPYIDLYVSQLKQAGFVPAYVRENLTVLAAFGRRLERWKLRVEDLNEDIVDRFLRKRYPQRRLPRHVRPTLHRLLVMLRESGATPLGSAAPLPNPAQQLTNKYRHFLTEERGISSSTACCWCPVVLRFYPNGLGPGS